MASASIRASKMASGKAGGGKIKNAGTANGGGGTGSAAPIKNAIGMCDVGGRMGSSYTPIKGAVS